MRRLTIVLPCYGRPERTRRMIDCIRDQDINNWEAFIIGDSCLKFLEIVNTQWYRDFVYQMSIYNNNIHTVDIVPHAGGYGYKAINHAIKNASGRYFIFAGNDDVILKHHFKHYLSGIEGSDYDFCYYNTWLDPHQMLRMSQPLYGAIGHSELIVRTDFIKTVEPHGPQYGHDWTFIENMMKRTDKHIKVNDEAPTYYIMSVPGKTNDTID